MNSNERKKRNDSAWFFEQPQRTANVMAAMTDEGGKAFSAKLNFVGKDGDLSPAVELVFESIDEMRSLADYLIGLAMEAKGATPTKQRKPADEWISVNDRLPEHGRQVVCADSQGRFWICLFIANDTYPYRPGFNSVERGEHINIYHVPLVTHWKPIVVPSEEERIGVLTKQSDNQRFINAGWTIYRETKENE